VSGPAPYHPTMVSPDPRPGLTEQQALLERPLLEVVDLKMHFPVRRGLLQRKVGTVKAVDGVSFHLRKGETLGLVGESGCGKTTVGRTILRLLEPTGGNVLFDGRDVLAMPAAELRQIRRRM